MSENPSISAVYREARAKPWDDLVRLNYLRAKGGDAPTNQDAVKVDVRETAQLVQYEIPVLFNKLIHQPHLENFFNAVHGNGKLNCPADEAFASEYVIHKANESITEGKIINITPRETNA